MSCYIRVKDAEVEQQGPSKTYLLLSDKQGSVKGCCSGLNLLLNEEYNTPGVHEDQEGFFVIEGTGWAKFGDEEFRLEPDMAMLAPAGVAHCMKKDPGAKVLKVLWFHAAI
ncbi:MAG TPA: cupin domain-containing protein [Bacillota bacterium]